MSEVVTGTDAIRRAVALRVKRMDYGRVAREVGIANETLVAFAEGRVQLSNERLCKLATELWQHTEFDPEQNLLRSTNRTPPQPMGIPPAPYDPEQHPSYLPDPVGGWTRGSFHLPPAPPPSRPAKRPGWL